MTPRDRAEETPPVGTDRDEQTDAAQVEADAAAAADDTALADAGLPQEGGTDGGSRPGSLAHRLYNGESGLDVVGKSRLIYVITAALVLFCLLSMIFRGFNFGIDFAGGNSFRLPGDSSVLTQVQEAAEGTGAEVATAQVVGTDTILLRTGALDNAGEREVIDAVADAAGIQ